MVIASNLVSMLIENDAHPDKPQQDEPHQQAGHHAGKIDPDIGDLAAAARHKELDGLIGQGCEQAAQYGPGQAIVFREEIPVWISSRVSPSFMPTHAPARAL